MTPVEHAPKPRRAAAWILCGLVLSLLWGLLLAYGVASLVKWVF